MRTGGAHFTLEVFPALQAERTGDHEKDILAIMTAVNATVESWVRQYPEQWFWVHKRWPKDAQ
jgi:KDO2-lipid IV(A) lauroyltransferase